MVAGQSDPVGQTGAHQTEGPMLQDSGEISLVLWVELLEGLRRLKQLKCTYSDKCGRGCPPEGEVRSRVSPTSDETSGWQIFGTR